MRFGVFNGIIGHDPFICKDDIVSSHLLTIMEKNSLMNLDLQGCVI